MRCILLVNLEFYNKKVHFVNQRFIIFDLRDPLVEKRYSIDDLTVNFLLNNIFLYFNNIRSKNL